MKFFLFLLFFPWLCLSQYPLQTENWDFQLKQQARMRKLGFHRVNAKLIGKHTESGTIFKKELNWEAFDDLGQFVERGISNGGKDTTTCIRYFSATGKFLGEAHFAHELKQFGQGREYRYDANDSLIEIRYRKSGQVIQKFDYQRLNDSTVRVLKFNDPLAQGLVLIGTDEVTRQKNRITIKSFKEDRLVHTKTIELDDAGRSIHIRDEGNYTNGEEQYVYDDQGHLVTKSIFGKGKQQAHLKLVWKYNANGDLNTFSRFENDKLIAIDVYQFKGSLLMKVSHTSYHPGWEEGYSFNYTYYENGLMKSSTTRIDKPTKVTYTYTYSYQ